MKKFFEGFKQFVSKGNVLDMAVGVIIGTSFSAIVTALVKKVLMPIIGWITGGISIASMSVVLNGVSMYLEDGATLNPDAVVLYYGEFIQAIIDFLIIAFVLYCLVKAMMGAKGLLTPKFCGFTKSEFKAMKKEGKTYDEIKALGEEKAKKEAEIKAAEESEKAKHTTEALLEDIKNLLAEQSKQ